MKKIRLSIDDHPFIIGKGVKVFVNGQKQPHVVEADEINGYIIKHTLDENGKPFIDPKYGGVAIDTVIGNMKIRLPFSLWWMRFPKWMGGI